MDFIYCEAFGYVHVYDERPSWWLLLLYSVTGSVQEGGWGCCSPHPSQTQSHDIILPPFMSCAISSKSSHPVFPQFPVYDKHVWLYHMASEFLYVKMALIHCMFFFQLEIALIWRIKMNLYSSHSGIHIL